MITALEVGRAAQAEARGMVASMRNVRAWLTCCVLVLLSCQRSAEPQAEATNSAFTRAAAPIRVAELLYDGEPKNGWLESKRTDKSATTKGPAQISTVRDASWTLSKKGLKQNRFGALVFRLRGLGAIDSLVVRLESADYTVLPRIPLRSDHLRALPDGSLEALIGFDELNPQHENFERVIWNGTGESNSPSVSIDGVALTVPHGPDRARAPFVAAGLRQHLQIDCTAAARPISPLIYGINYSGLTPNDEGQWQLAPTARRWGGNTTSRYNWEIGNVWNTGRDWYWENVEVPPYTAFLDANAAHGVQTALTVPMIGWVAKDATSFSFPISTRGPQQFRDANYRPDAGNGVDTSGALLKPPAPTQTSVPAPPEFIARWVKAIRERDRARGKRSVDIYMLDNEPALWHQTHRDVHPDPVTYDELLDRTLRYGEAIRAADPEARIAGPAAWGWPELFYSAKDSSWGLRLRPDRRAHGDVPLLPWYLRRLREEEKRTGKHILDLVDVHFYPQAEGLYGPSGGTDPSSAALRIRSTRALWDRSYTDESYINEPVQLLPRLHAWIDANFPGLGIVIGEWNFGGEKHMSGALATAEALGRFGQHDVTAAYYWTSPPAGSPTSHAFRAFRDFDGKKARFLDYALTTYAEDPSSLFASRDAEGKHVVAVVLNFAPDKSIPADIELTGCGEVTRRTAYVYTDSAGPGFQASPTVSDEGTHIRQALSPYSITVLDIQLAAPIPTAVAVP